MSDYDGLPRPLPFPLRSPITIIGDTSEEPDCEGSSFVWPDDSDERVLVPFSLSLNEYNILANTIDVGRDIAYGDSAIAVWSLWTRQTECSVSICDIVADCFANDPEFRQSVIDSLKSDPLFQQVIQGLSGRAPEPQIEGQIFGGDCDEDVVAGRIIALVDKMNTRNVDFLEIVEVRTNDEERVFAVLSAIPVIGESHDAEILGII